MRAPIQILAHGLARRDVTLLVLSSVVLLFFDLGWGVLATNDETRFPMLARDILERGHWLLPRLNGIPHLNKPPLTAWLITLAAWPAGAVTQWNAALPTLMAGLGVVLGTYWIARQLFDAGVGIVAGLVVLTTYGVFTMARAPMPDMLLCAAFTAAMVAYAAAEFGGHGFARVAFYGLVGVAFWTKGPAGFLPLAVVVVDTVVTHGWSGLARLVSAPGLLLLTLLTMPWWVVAAAAGREQFVRNVVLTDFLQWYLPTRGWSWHRVTAPLNQTLTILLPWSLLLPGALWSAIRPGTDPEGARRARLLLVWCGVVFVLIAVSQEQRMRYYLPLVPPAALLVARWCAGRTLRRRPAVFAGVWVSVALGLSLWHVHTEARRNAAMDLGAIAGKVRTAPMPLYAVETPELVVAFYLQRPVTLLPTYHQFERYVDDGYLIIGERALTTPPIAPIRQVATALVEGRRYLMLAKQRPGFAGSAEPN